MKISAWFAALRCLCGLIVFTLSVGAAPSLMENLNRGVVALRTSSTDVFISWRFLGTDPADATYNVYRAEGGGAPVLLNGSPISAPTHFTDTTANLSLTNVYTVTAIVGGVEQPSGAGFTLSADSVVKPYLSIPLQVPAGGTNPSGAYEYTANDCSVGDLDGDGEYELIVKWDPTNSQDNSIDGYTGNVYLDAYKLNGTRLWRIDLGRNIRAGAHYTQFLVYDFDGDGRAEIVCKTAPNTMDGTGTYIGSPAKFLGTPTAAIDHNADYRNSAGYIRTGPEFFTIFDGLTGGELVTTNYVVPRNNNPASNDVTAWGDDYGNRVDRFLACVAYLDGQRPSIVLCRGYYTRAVLAAWDWRDGQLKQRWVFDTGNVGTANALADWRGQGAHSLTVGDVDGDGRDEITYGAAAIDDDGTGLYSTKLGHGDALHMSDMDPSRPGQEVWMVHEEPASYGANGLEFRDAKTGALIFGVGGNGEDIGRGCAGDIDPRYLGYEMWASRGGIYSTNGTQILASRPSPVNFMVWWDGDLLREFLDNITISKWNWTTNRNTTILTATGAASNNTTKATPNLSADILGDWREEVVWRASDSSELRIYTTTIPTTYRIPTLMHDRQYREAIAWQNVAYNQPPHPSYYLGDGMSAAPMPDIVTSLAALGTPTPVAVSIKRLDPFTSGTTNASVVYRVTFNTPVTGVDAADFSLTLTGSVTGVVASVSAQSATSYNVTIGSITGAGTIRLDLNASGTGITAVNGGAALVGGFNTGQTYTRISTLAYIRTTTGGLWSDPDNWDGGVIADGTGSTPTFGNFDLTANNTVTLDGPRTLGGTIFGDTQVSSAASWIVTDAGTPANTLTLDVAAGNPVVTVNALGTGATAKFDTSLLGNDGLTKDGAGTLVLSKANSLTGVINVTAGILRIDTGGSLANGNTTVNVMTTANATIQVNGGSFTSSGLVTLGNGSNPNGGIFRVDAGTVALNGGIRTNNDSASALRVTGGTFTATDVNIRRNAGTSPDYTTGFVVTGGTSTVGTIGLGTNNSYGSLSVEGGSLTATGAVTVANQSTAGRGGAVRVLGGRFTSTETTNGIILSRANVGSSSTNANNVALMTVTGGVTTAEKITLGFDSVVNAGSSTLRVNGGTLFLGSGGIVKNGTSGLTSVVELSSGTVGAKANWATSHPVSLPSGGNVTLRAADEAGVARNISLTGVISGAGGFTKTGDGVLTLGATNTFTGGVTVNGGTLTLAGSLASGGTVAVNSGGVLAGTSSTAKPVTLNSGGSVSPGNAGIGTLSGASLTWNGGGHLAIDLSATSDRLALSGALTKGSAGVYAVDFTTLATPVIGATHTLATFGSTTFVATDFTANGLGYVRGDFGVTAGALTFTITSDGSGWNAFNSWAATSGLPPGSNGPSDDFDGDGSSNLLEFILGTDATAAGADAVSLVKITDGGQEYPALRYTRRVARGDVKIETRAATALDFAVSLGSVEVSVTPQGDGTELVIVRSAAPFLQEPRQFLRLFVTLP
ncbi:MAG: autotransporter-associated beta strand repeat-containing protein [Nibricoccus sp.]